MSAIKLEILPATDDTGLLRDIPSPDSTLRVKPSRKKTDPSSEWKCLACNKHFSDKYCLEKHHKICKGDVKNPPTGSPKASNEFNAYFPSTAAVTKKQRRRHFCALCPKCFCEKRYLVYHIKTYHPTVEVDSTGPSSTIKKLLQCPVCLVWSKTMNALSDHIKDTHSGVQVPGFLFFDTVAEFRTWKHQEEITTVSGFIKTHGSQNKNIEHYYCRRSGKFMSRSSQKRQMRLQGTCKVGSECPASMTAVFTPRGVMVLYSSTHSGHSREVRHTVLSEIDREFIARKISSGIKYEEILDQVRSSLSSTKVTRLHLLQRRDLNNIARDFHLSKSQRRNAAESVRVWVEICRQEASDIVRFIKFQGEEDAFSIDGRIGLDDFMIVLMNDVQVDMLQKYGHHRVNCIDSTHGANSYNFQLTTLLVFDDHGEAFPVAFCVSSRVDAMVMEVFLEHVRTAIGGPVEGAILMTDNSPVFANAWQTVMGLPGRHILCSWFVDGNWKKNLSKIKHPTEVKTQVYKMLRVLLEADNKEKFHSLLESSLRDLGADEGMTKFVSYFRREFVSRPEVWAYSYWRGLHSVNSTHLEAFHQTLKQVFIPERKVKRLDLSLNALLRLLRFKTFERILKQEGCVLSQPISDISERHTLSSELTREQIDVCENEIWIVHDDPEEDYRVTRALPEELSRLHSSNAHLCPLVCDICNVCVHTLACTCMDYKLRNTVCKHIHAVVQLCGIAAFFNNSETDAHGDVEDLPEQEGGVIDSDNELNGSSVDNEPEPADSSQRSAEMNVLLKAECNSTNDGDNCNDSENSLREFDALIRSIKSSIVGEMNLDVIAIANEGLKTAFAQIAAAKLQSSQSASLPGVYLEEVADMETDEEWQP